MDYYLQIFLRALAVAAIVGAISFFIKIAVKKPASRALTEAAFAAYISGVLWLVGICDVVDMLWFRLVENNGGYDIMFFCGDFRIFPEFKGIDAEMLANFIMLLPFGILFALSHRVGLLRTLVWAVVFVLAIELFQPIINRTFDTNDIILNFSGAAISALIYFAVRELLLRKKEKENPQKR